MAIDRNSNGFTFTFAIVMVIVVGSALALAAESLKPFQQENMKQEKMKNILMAVQLMSKDDDMKDAPAMFAEVVEERYILSFDGSVIDEFTMTSDEEIDPANKLDPFNIDTKKEFKTYIQPILNANKGDNEKIMEELSKVDGVHYPLFKCNVEGEEIYVVPMVGSGLWGPIWGFMGIKPGGEIYAAVFDHKTETPGLGAEINTEAFQLPFKGRTVFPGGTFAPVTVVKSGQGDEISRVDGITGGTITSVGVGEMLERTLSIYAPFFEGDN